MSKFVTIEKNGKSKSVSYPVYCNYFQNAGWRVVGEDTPTPSVVENEVAENKADEAENEVTENATDVEDEVDDDHG